MEVKPVLTEQLHYFIAPTLFRWIVANGGPYPPPLFDDIIFLSKELESRYDIPIYERNEVTGVSWPYYLERLDITQPQPCYCCYVHVSGGPMVHCLETEIPNKIVHDIDGTSHTDNDSCYYVYSVYCDNPECDRCDYMAAIGYDNLGEAIAAWNEKRALWPEHIEEKET